MTEAACTTLDESDKACQLIEYTGSLMRVENESPFSEVHLNCLFIKTRGVIIFTSIFFVLKQMFTVIFYSYAYYLSNVKTLDRRLSAREDSTVLTLP